MASWTAISGLRILEGDFEEGPGSSSFEVLDEGLGDVRESREKRGLEIFSNCLLSSPELVY